MTVTINGTTGIDKVQDAVVQNATLASGVPSTAKLPAGTVLQVVQGTATASVSSSSSTYSDTGLSATITPTSATSKILVIVSHPQCAKNTNNIGLQLKLVRNGSDVVGFSTYLGYTGSGLDQYFYAGGSYLDSPASASALTYKTQFGSYNSGSAVVVQAVTPSSIILMEIAA